MPLSTPHVSPEQNNPETFDFVTFRIFTVALLDSTNAASTSEHATTSFRNQTILSKRILSKQATWLMHTANSVAPQTKLRGIYRNAPGHTFLHSELNFTMGSV